MWRSGRGGGGLRNHASEVLDNTRGRKANNRCGLHAAVHPWPPLSDVLFPVALDFVSDPLFVFCALQA